MCLSTLPLRSTISANDRMPPDAIMSIQERAFASVSLMMATGNRPIMGFKPVISGGASAVTVASSWETCRVNSDRRRAVDRDGRRSFNAWKAERGSRGWHQAIADRPAVRSFPVRSTEGAGVSSSG
jgi:hypothetical protein